MGRIRGKRPSAAMVVSIVALVFAIAGTSIAGVALTKKEKKQTRSIAKDEINKAAPGLSVANATNAQNASNAQNANAVGGIPPSQIGAIGRTNFDSGSCFDDDHNGTNCISTALNLPRSGRVLVIATAAGTVNAFDDPSDTGDLTAAVGGRCQISLDGVPIAAEAETIINQYPNKDSVALNRVTGVLPPGSHSFTLRCTEDDGRMSWDQPSISAVMLGSD
jgi:hypothetical protein